MPIFTTTISTPVGNLLAGATGAGICLLDFPYRKMIEAIKVRISISLGEPFAEGEHPHFIALRAQLKEYFKGERMTFDLPLVMAGSPFQQQVWKALQDIPYGETRSYKAQSVLLGSEGAIRAIARANGENGLAILVPCHRVIGENGSLTGYSGGLDKKRWLLTHERSRIGREVQGELFG